MITLNFDAALIRAAQANQAKKDVRYYLCGILLTTTGDIVGTDGHTLFHTKHDWADCDSLPCDVIVSIDGIIPVAANTVRIEFPDFEPADIVTGVTGTVTTDKGKLFACKLIDGRFPDFNRVIPTRLSDTGEYSNAVAVDASLIARVEKTFGKGAQVVIYHRKANDSLRIEGARPDGTVAIMAVMPLSVGHFKQGESRDFLELHPGAKKSKAA